MWTRMAGKDISVPNNSSQLGASKNSNYVIVISFGFHDPRYITYPSLPPRRFGIGTKDLHKGFCFPHDPHLETQTDRPQAFFSWSSPAASESVASVRWPRGPLGGCRPPWLSPLCLGSTWFESAAPIRINDSNQDLAFVKMQISGILMAWPMTPGKKR